MYEGSSILVSRVCVDCRVTEDFSVRVGVHQESAIRPFLFSVVMNEVIKEIQWFMLFADDIILVRENFEDGNNRLDEWILGLEGKRLMISRNKT